MANQQIMCLHCTNNVDLNYPAFQDDEGWKKMELQHKAGCRLATTRGFVKNRHCDSCEQRVTKELSFKSSKYCNRMFLGFYCDECYKKVETEMIINNHNELLQQFGNMVTIYDFEVESQNIFAINRKLNGDWKFIGEL